MKTVKKDAGNCLNRFGIIVCLGDYAVKKGMIKVKRCSGILAHPTSFPSRYGIGDFGRGAYDFVDYCYECGQDLWQVLPLGPTIYADSPYQSFSTFAGNTMLLSPDILAEEGYIDPSELEFAPEFDERTTDYGKVIEYKNELFAKAYQNFIKTGTAAQKLACERFKADNAQWLDDYALFRAVKNHLIELRATIVEAAELTDYRLLNKSVLSPDEINDYYYGAVWGSWPEDLKKRKPNALESWRKKLCENIDKEMFLQYEFFRQWGKLKNYANSLGISIIGDIPIFVAMDSSDVWSNPELFYLNAKGNPELVAGVPPDYFSETGQLWGNPLYNWKKHRETGYKWWELRIASALAMVDILRIDHFRGFDEYWAIPYGEPTAINGEWQKGPGIELFNTLKARLGSEKFGNAAIIAEDLGILTDSVVELRKQAGFPGMKVLQFAFSSGPTNDYLPHSFTEADTVVYTGTHDNDTSIGWYREAGEKERDLYRRYMDVSGDNVNWDLIRLAFASCANYAVVPIQDLFGLGSEARMNKPGEPSGWWRFRFTLDMLNDFIKNKLLYLGQLFNRLPERLMPVEEEELTEDMSEAEKEKIERIRRMQDKHKSGNTLKLSEVES